jgi:hypothetical protein
MVKEVGFPVTPGEAGATEDSLKRIKASLQEARQYFGVAPEAEAWHQIYYQVCNRLAHLYFLNEKLHVPTWLVWLFIVDAPEWQDRAGPGPWARRFAEALSDIGMPGSFPLRERVAVVFAPPAPDGPAPARASARAAP